MLKIGSIFLIVLYVLCLSAESIKAEVKFNVLRETVGMGDLKKLKDLAQLGADLKQTDGNGNTLLMYAAEVGSPEMVRYLTAKGLDVNAKGRLNPPALERAIMAMRPLKVVQILIESGADVNHIMDDGMPLFMRLALLHNTYNAKETEAMLALMKKKGADINAVDLSDKTAVQWALENGNVELVKFLKRLGAKDAIKEKPLPPENFSGVWRSTESFDYQGMQVPVFYLKILQNGSELNGLFCAVDQEKYGKVKNAKCIGQERITLKGKISGNTARVRVSAEIGGGFDFIGKVVLTKQADDSLEWKFTFIKEERDYIPKTAMMKLKE